MNKPFIGEVFWHYDYATEAVVYKVDDKDVYLITKNGTTFHLPFEEFGKFWKKKEEKHA